MIPLRLFDSVDSFKNATLRESLRPRRLKRKYFYLSVLSTLSLSSVKSEDTYLSMPKETLKTWIEFFSNLEK